MLTHGPKLIDGWCVTPAQEEKETGNSKMHVAHIIDSPLALPR